MSSYLGIAAALSALKETLNVGYVEVGVNAQVPELGPPVAPSSSEGVVRIFPYRFGFVPSARNDDVPTRGRDGQLRVRPKLALELHALVCFGSTDTDLNVRIAGATAAILHGRPYLNPDVIADEALSAYLDKVNVTLDLLSSEDLSRLWSSLFEIDYVLALPVRLGGLLVEAADAPSRVVLPVRTPTLYIRTFGGPVLESIAHVDGATSPIEADQQVVLTGTSLRATSVRVRIGANSYALKTTGSEPEHRDSLSPTELVFGLYTREDTDSDEVPDASVPLDGLRAGIHLVQVWQDYVASEDDATVFVPGTRGVASNALPMAVRPRIESDPAPSGTTGGVTVNVVPAVDATQTCRLFLAPVSPATHSYILTTHAGTDGDGNLALTTTQTLAAGTYKLRLQVDGLDNVPAWSGTAFVVPTVTIGA